MEEKIILFNNDCLKEMENIPENSIDLVFTDPPYGINYKSNKQTGDTRKGKEIKVREYSYFSNISGDEKLMTEYLPKLYTKLIDGGALYLFCHWKYWSELEKAVSHAGFKVKNMIVIHKSNHGMGDLHGGYAPKHELILFASKGRHVFQKSEYGRGSDVIYGKVLFSGSHRWHPNEKPVSWLTPIIARSCRPEGTILDPFMGSGSIGVACKALNRKFIGIEINDEYFKIAKNRLELQE